MLLGSAAGEDRMSGFGEALQLILRCVRRHAVGDALDQALHVHGCPETPYRVGRQGVFKRVRWGGMQEKAMINPQAQDHAVACALSAGLLGPRAPAFMRLPVLHKTLDEPPQSLAWDNVARAPTQV